MMNLTRYGKREWLGGGIIALALVVAGVVILRAGLIVFGWTLGLSAVAAWLCVAAFFRVPSRRIPQEAGIMVSPADGIVKDVGIVTDHGIEPFADQPLMCIGIFLSIFDVHVNRAPADMRITHRRHTPGRYLDARNPRCARENEALYIAGTAQLGEHSIPVAIRQISGAIARRIVCEVEPGGCLTRGEIYGMIKFGSRTELYFPANQQITPAVAEGSRVFSGSTIIAKLKQ
jgi:phosphatidylserine decarboxylase